MDDKVQERIPEVGERVIWHDSRGRGYEALVTCSWGPTCVNLVFVSGDETKKDSCGRQIERQTSAPYKTVQRVHGFYWRYPEDEPNPYVAPAAA